MGQIMTMGDVASRLSAVVWAWISDEIRARGWTQATFARAVRVSPTAVSEWKSGRSSPTIDTLDEIMHRLGLDYARELRRMAVRAESPAVPVTDGRGAGLVAPAVAEKLRRRGPRTGRRAEQ